MQHLWLVFILVALEETSRLGDPTNRHEDIVKILEECHLYSTKHFATEMILIESIGYKVDLHKKEHKRFLKAVHDSTFDFKNIDPQDARAVSHKANELHDYLRDWLLSHIAITDRDPIAIHLRGLPNKNEIVGEWVSNLRTGDLLHIRKSQKVLYDIVERDILMFRDKSSGKIKDGLGGSFSPDFAPERSCELGEDVAIYYGDEARKRNISLSTYVTQRLNGRKITGLLKYLYLYSSKIKMIT
ncbi:MAG: hemerythrin family protein [Leptospiraceae bacterium]|nr:hemerythrin family protein [Leptospiraceae bacterium]MCZ8345377.1 hemerythrin family protein [Leptospiraceae bacterium]